MCQSYFNTNNNKQQQQTTTTTTNNNKQTNKQTTTNNSYKGQPDRYMARLQGLLDSLDGLSAEQLRRFHVLGGECNYLFTCDETRTLKTVEFPSEETALWSAERVTRLLDVAEKSLNDTILRLGVSGVLVAVVLFYYCFRLILICFFFFFKKINRRFAYPSLHSFKTTFA